MDGRRWRAPGALLTGLVTIGVIWWSPSFSTSAPEEPEPEGPPDGLYLEISGTPGPGELVRVRPTEAR